MSFIHRCWFFTSPDPRFANALFFLLAYSAALGLLCALQPLLSKHIFAGAVLVVLVAVNFLLVKYSVGRYSYKDISFSGWLPETTAPLVEKWTTSGREFTHPPMATSVGTRRCRAHRIITRPCACACRGTWGPDLRWATVHNARRQGGAGDGGG